MPLINPDCPQSPYPYCPNFPTAVVFSVLFVVVTIIAFVQYIRLRSWFFYWMIIALLCEDVGLVARAIFSKHLTDLHAFVVQYVLIIVAPSLMAAACYMAFGRLVWYISPHSKLNFRSLWIPPRWITPIFVSFDAVTFFVQMVGITAAATAVHPDNVDVDQLQNGLKVAKVGLILQMACFLLFAVIGTHLLIVSRQWMVRTGDVRSQRWQLLNLAINAAATLITIRALYRILEFSASVSSPEDEHGVAWYLYSHEWPAYVLDSVLILISCAIMNLIHPGYFLPHEFMRPRLIKKNVRRAKQVEEQEGQGMQPLGSYNSRSKRTRTLSGRFIETGRPGFPQRYPRANDFNQQHYENRRTQRF